jgi:outer membrane protein assembly factor BamA
MRFLLFISFNIFLSFAALAQTDSIPANIVPADSVPKKHKAIGAILYNSDSMRSAKVELGGIKFTPFVGPSVAPETGFMLSFGGLLTFTFQRRNPILQRSSLPISLGYSSTGAFTLSVKNTFYGPNDRVRVTGELWYKDMPDNYWGVGYDNAHDVPKSDSTTEYHRKWTRFYQKLVVRIGKAFFVGGIIDFTNTVSSNINPRMAADPDYLKIGDISRNTGLGIAFQYDTRDVPVNAYKGIYMEFAALAYDKFLGGQNRFQTIDLDYRQYKELHHRHTLAWQVKTRNTFGKGTPWTDMALLGSPQDLRGYYWGRYRDRNYAYVLVEYRHMFNRARPDKKGSYDSRFGFATWYGNGILINDEGRSNYIPCVGAGLRFEVQSRMNLRIDYGVGKNSNAFYLSFNEAF